VARDEVEVRLVECDHGGNIVGHHVRRNERQHRVEHDGIDRAGLCDDGRPPRQHRQRRGDVGPADPLQQPCADARDRGLERRRRGRLGDQQHGPASIGIGPRPAIHRLGFSKRRDPHAVRISSTQNGSR
jgi:hypothetical protein